MTSATRSLSDPAPSATIVLLRGAEAPEIFLVRRHRLSGFLPNVHVFPGGRLDADDHTVASRVGGVVGLDSAELTRRMSGLNCEIEASALLIAAVRETFEEAGVLLAEDEAGATLPADATLSAARDALNGGTTRFSDILASHRLRVRGGALTYFDQWITPELEGRRFDTRFFLAAVDDAQVASHDGHETTEGSWLTAVDALARHDAGSLGLAPPTLWVLESLARLGNREQILTWARRREVPAILPRLVHDGGRLIVAMPGDPLHPAAGNRPVTRRVVWEDDRWRIIGFELES